MTIVIYFNSGNRLAVPADRVLFINKPESGYNPENDIRMGMIPVNWANVTYVREYHTHKNELESDD